MKIKPLLILLPLLFFSLILPSDARSAAETRASAAFTYQGHLEQDGQPVTASCDFEFSLWDDAQAGAQVGNTQAVSSLAVTDGLFSAALDFGPEAFNGPARFLQIAVRCPSDQGDFVLLSPRHELTAAPYAGYAQRADWSGLQNIPAGFADGVDNDTDTLYSAGAGLILTGAAFSLDEAYLETTVINVVEENSDNWFTEILSQTLIEGDWFTTIVSNTVIHNTQIFSSTFQLAVSGGCPAGSSISAIHPDGSVDCETDDDTTYTAGPGLALNGTEFSAIGSSYQNVIVVAKSGGDFTAIQAALDSITDASAGSRYLVWVGPGVYEEQVTMKAYVDLVGSGPGVTAIRCPASNTLVLASHSSVRDLSVQADSGGQAYAAGVYASDVSDAKLQNLVVEVTASGGSSPELRGIHAVDSTLTLDNVEISSDATSSVTAGIYASGGTLDIFGGSIQVFSANNCYGVRGTGGARLNITSANIAAGGSTFYGVYATGETNLVDTQIVLGRVGTTYGTGYGLYANGSFYLTLLGSQVSIPTGATGSVQVSTAYFIYLMGGPLTRITSSQLFVVDPMGVSTDTGIYLGTAGMVGLLYLDNTQVFGMDTSLRGNAGWSVYAGASQLAGTLNKNGAATTCAASYNGNYTALASNCLITVTP